MLATKINLTKLDKVAIMKGKKGQTLLVIDVAASHLFQSEKGNIFMDLIHFETPEGEYGDYAVKQSVPKDVREYEKENNVTRPFLGNTEKFTPGETKPETADPDSMLEGGSEEVPY